MLAAYSFPITNRVVGFEIEDLRFQEGSPATIYIVQYNGNTI